LPIIDAAGKQTSLNSSETLLFIPAVWVVLRVLCSFFYLLNVWFVCAGKAVDIYAKFDVINLAAERSYNNLDITLKEALKHRAPAFERVHTCLLTETLSTIAERLVVKKVHRLIVVDQQQKVTGIVSLSDVLKFLVLTTHELGTDM
ncbi:5'-AMP-activated protein kinase subunit gamma-1, partial [Geodia barretti]